MKTPSGSPTHEAKGKDSKEHHRLGPKSHSPVEGAIGKGNVAAVYDCAEYRLALT